MKQTYIYQTGCWIICLLLLFSCEKVDLDKGVTARQGLLNVMVAIPNQTTEYAATTPGPYAEGDTIFVKVPSTEDSPLDLKHLKPFASLGHNSRIEPALGSIMDFSSPVKVRVINGAGVATNHIIKVIPSLPKTVFSKLWFKTSDVIGVKRTNISGLAISGDYLLVADFNAGATGVDNGLRVLNKNTGELIKSIAPPTTYCMQVASDDAGHFIVNRYNIYSAGFVVYYYENIDSEPKQILNFTTAAGCPVNLGRKVSVIGNLKTGKAFIYATTNGNNNIYFWEFQDGTVVKPEPTIIRYAGAEAWTYAAVQRKSLDPLSDHYFTYCNYNTADPNLTQGSRFVSFNPDMEVTTMATQNHYYKILGFNVFKVQGEEFTTMLTQGYYAWDATHLKVFETKDRSKFSLVPGASGYADFMLFQSEAYGGTNYNRYGDVVADVRGNEVYFYATMATNAVTTSGVMVYKMKYNKP